MREFIGVDDLAALGEGQKLAATHAIEIWQEDRKVGNLVKQQSVKMRARNIVLRSRLGR